MKKLTILLFSILISSSGLTDVQIKNFYFERTESIDSTHIIISTNETINVKCAIFDKNDKPIRVSNEIVTPPLSEVIITSSDAFITSAQCWEQEPTYEQVREKLLRELIESIESIREGYPQEDISNELKSNYINQIAARVRKRMALPRC